MSVTFRGKSLYMLYRRHIHLYLTFAYHRFYPLCVCRLNTIRNHFFLFVHLQFSSITVLTSKDCLCNLSSDYDFMPCACSRNCGCLPGFLYFRLNNIAVIKRSIFLCKHHVLHTSDLVLMEEWSVRIIFSPYVR